MPNKKVVFLHNEGHGGAGFRKGTDLVLTAFQQLYNTHKDMVLFINSQCSEQEHSQLHNRSINCKWSTRSEQQRNKGHNKK
ncbi:hypothetical protein LCGC14_1806280 [marine sediment metagenome]|uniref:Uncharacterized protein n=1 Tax=marine sediment metagenome TaxID=412755 RepID=A0A0F9GN41_9ZZZZ